ncbi:hypothetical protein RHGRI_021465 [Rhododendron griersonianum]|uniref:Uncharacterized protein n=1 Tax=Rhododendron griersonianum TaxID=479676 RepID=A0AAV6JP90_9ERIC|nr:hypothetical protein RHGRI_021465 [Rhododendron griersonianum]
MERTSHIAAATINVFTLLWSIFVILQVSYNITSWSIECVIGFPIEVLVYAIITFVLSIAALAGATQANRRLLAVDLYMGFVVINEAHAYKGAFGYHTALILRRLRRLCSHVYGSDPSFVFCTVTSGNPREHAMELANLPTMELIQNDGSPSGRKLFVLWNPPLNPNTVLKTTSSRDTKVSLDKNMGHTRSR